MKAIMYHYVRSVSGGYPFLRYLHRDDFVRQLEFFESEFGLMSFEAFTRALDTGQAGDGVVLTFDDAMCDHWDIVAPILRDRGLWAIFYVPTGPYLDGRLLDVHRVHLLLGRLGGHRLVDVLGSRISESMLVPEHIEAFENKPYQGQENDRATDYAKRCLNYYIRDEFRSVVLEQLIQEQFGDESNLASEFCVTERQIAKLQQLGMIVGNHSHSHPVFAKLDENRQREELTSSFDFLESVTGGLRMRTFCYPYGGFHSFNATTERLLGQCGCSFAFNVEARDIGSVDLSGRPFALPRYDCNLFPNGSARLEHSE